MTDKLARLTAEQRANFVAYLDGELDEGQSRQIEQLLAQNEVARHDLESLAATWELLDIIPRPQASETFTQNTIATLKMENQQVSLQDQPWFTRSKQIGQLFGSWLAVIICGVVGFLAMRSFPPSQEDALIENYTLLKNLEDYQEIGSVEFLEKLQKSVAWSRRNQSATGGQP